MLKIPPSRLAVAALGAFVIVVGPPAAAQFTPKPALPRQDTVRTQDDELSQDSRAGGALAPETPAGGVEAIEAPTVGVPTETIVSEGDRMEIGGKVLNIGKNRLVLSVSAPRGATARKQNFKVPDDVEVTKNGEPASLNALRPGDLVRLETAPGDRDLVVTIIAMDQSEGSLNIMENDPGVEVDDIGSEAPAERPVAAAREEAVLPLGVEVYAVKNAALVTEMSAGGPAAQAGVRIGDLILAINGKPIVNAEKIEAFLARSSGRPVLTIQRGKRRMNVTVSPTRVAENALVDPAGIQRTLGNYGFGGVPVTVNPGAIGAGPVVAPGGLVGEGGVAPAGANVENGGASDPNAPRNDFRSPGGSSEAGPAGFQSPGAPETGAPNTPSPGAGSGTAPGEFRSPGAPSERGGNSQAPQTPQSGTNVTPEAGQTPTTGQ